MQCGQKFLKEERSAGVFRSSERLPANKQHGNKPQPHSYRELKSANNNNEYGSEFCPQRSQRRAQAGWHLDFHLALRTPSSPPRFLPLELWHDKSVLTWATKVVAMLRQQQSTDTDGQDAGRPVTGEGHPGGRDNASQGRWTVSALGEEQACLEAGACVLCGLRKVLTGPLLFPPVEPAPPVLVFNQTEEILIVNATYQLPHCLPQPDMNYEVNFWKEGTKNKVRSPFHAPTNWVPFLTLPADPRAPHPPSFVPECLLQEAFHAYPSLRQSAPWLCSVIGLWLTSAPSPHPRGQIQDILHLHITASNNTAVFFFF